MNQYWYRCVEGREEKAEFHKFLWSLFSDFVIYLVIRVCGVFTGSRTRVSEYPAQRANHCTMNSAQRATSQWADTVLRAIIGDNLIRHLGFVKHCLQVSVLWCSCINHNAKRCSCFAIIISKNVILYRTYLLNTVRWMLAIASRCC